MDNLIEKTNVQLSKYVEFSQEDSSDKIIASVRRGEAITRYTLNSSIVGFLKYFTEPKTIGSVVRSIVTEENDSEFVRLINFAKEMLKTPLLEFEVNESHINTAQNVVESLGFSLVTIFKDRKYDGVYQVKDKDNHTYVMKVVKTKRQSKNAMILKDKIKNEHDILKQFSANSNIVNAEHYSDESYTYMLLEYIEGENLTQEITITKDVHTKFELCTQLIDCIAILHEKSFFHGDIHTSNFLVSNGQLTMIDLDCACSDDYQYIPRVGGALHFTPPENLLDNWFSSKAELPTIAAEVYQLGVVLYFVLNGVPPFRGDTYQLLRKDILERKNINSIECFDDEGLNKAITDIILLCISEDPQKRPVSVNEIKREWLKVKREFNF